MVTTQLQEQIMSVEKNSELFNQITVWNGAILEECLDENFDKSLENFRDATSKGRTINDQDYPAVYLNQYDFGGLTIHFDTDKTLSLIINLEFYYVYGFYFDGTVYAYKGESFSALTSHGFECTEIPFGDSYPDIEANLSANDIAELKKTGATKDKLLASLATLADETVPFTDKCEAILVVFWSLIEGVRFQEISSAVNDSLNGSGTEKTDGDFYKLAEDWANLSVDAAKHGILNPAIAVYELHRISG
jgi:hypothetical protein